MQSDSVQLSLPVPAERSWLEVPATIVASIPSHWRREEGRTVFTREALNIFARVSSGGKISHKGETLCYKAGAALVRDNGAYRLYQPWTFFVL